MYCEFCGSGPSCGVCGRSEVRLVVKVIRGDERARIYPEGGIGYDVRVPGIGWVVNDSDPGPSPEMERLAFAVLGRQLVAA